MVEIDTNRRMSDLPHGDLETLAQLTLVGSEKDTSDMIGTSGQLSASAFQRGHWHVDDPTLIYNTDYRVLMPTDGFMFLGRYMFKASRDMNIDRKRLMQWVKPRTGFVQCIWQKNQKETLQPGGYPQESGFEQPLYDWFCRRQQNVWLNYRLIRICIRSFVRTIGKKIQEKSWKTFGCDFYD